MPSVKRQRKERIRRLRSAIGDKRVIGLPLEIRIFKIDVSDTMRLRRKHHQAPAIHKQGLNFIYKCKMTDMVDTKLSFKTVRRTTKRRCHDPSVRDNCIERPSAIQKFICASANAIERCQVKLNQIKTTRVF